MNNLMENYIQSYLHRRQATLRLVGALSVLALLVATGVFWQLHHTGIAMTNQVDCGLEEHTHGDECYTTVLSCALEEGEDSIVNAVYEETTVLVCSMDESEGHTHDDSCYDEEGVLTCTETESAGHTHTDSCYSTEEVLVTEEQIIPGHIHDDSCYTTVLTCETPEHTHDISCLADLTADVESADDWKATLPELTGNYAEDVVAIAQSQLGYTESSTNFILSDDGTTRKGYTRYGEWYGLPYGDWCAMFVSFCLHYAGVPEEDFPEAAGVYAWIESLKELEIYADAEDYTPRAGDIIFFDSNSDGRADHVGIVEALELDEDGEIVAIYTIEGNYSDSVAENKYDPDDTIIVGYGILPEAEETVTQPGEEEDFSETVTYTATADGAAVTVVAPLGALPEGAELSVVLIEESSEAYSEAAEAIGFDGSQEDAGLVVLDITFILNGEEVEPTEAVQVTIDAAQLIPEAVDLTTVEVQHLEQTENGVEAVLVAAADEGMDTEAAVAEFTVDSFSSFTITWGSGSNSSSVTVTLKDTDGNELTASTGNVNISNTNTDVTFADQAPTISGYTYSYTEVTYKSGSSTTANTMTATTFRMSKSGNSTTIYINGASYSNVSNVSVTMYYTADSSSGTTVSAAGTITWTANSEEMTYGVNAYNTSGSTISLSSGRITSFTGSSLLMDTLASNTIISSSSSGGGGGGQSSSSSYVLSYATVVIDNTTYGSSDNGVIKLERSEVDDEGYITYTITYADNTTETVKQETGTDDYTAPVINLYYTTSSSSYALTQSHYNSSSYLWYDVSEWTTTTTGGTATTKAGQDSDNRDKIDSITLNGITVAQGDSSRTSSFGSTDGTTASTLTDYFGSSVDTSTTGTLTLSIKATNGYYVTEIVIACCGGMSDANPYSCGTFTSGSAFDQEFSVSADGTVTVEISSAYFGHSSDSSNYFILIFVAPVPSPLYVEYDYGDIVSLIGNGTSTAFESGTGWTTASDSNVYVYSEDTEYDSNDNLDKISGVLTKDTQFKYVYSRSDNEDTSNWVHVANSITDEAIAQAAAAGYYFAGWKAYYYTEMDSVSNGNNSAIYDYTLNFSETSLFSTQTFGAGDTVALLTNVRLVAQWEPYTVTVTKTVSGLPTSDSTNRTYTFTLEVSENGGTTWTTVSENIQITVSGANSTVTYTVSAASDADYVYVVKPGMMFRLTENTEGLSTITIGDESYYYGGVNYSPQTGTVSTSTAAVALSAVNVYSDVEPVHIKKVNESNEELTGATFTLQRSSDSKYYTGTSWSSYSRTISLGTLTLGGLADDTYILTETAAPNGYNRLDATITFTVKNGEVTEVKYGNEAEDSSSVVSYDKDTRTITVVNTSGVTLPNTGGAGTTLYTMMGLMLLSVASCLMYIHSRRREEESS